MGGNQSKTEDFQADNGMRTLKKLCGVISIDIENDFWSKDVEELSFDLANIEPEEIERNILIVQQEMRQNNLHSRNLQTLMKYLIKMLTEYRLHKESFATINEQKSMGLMNLLFLTRLFVRHLIEVCDGEELEKHISTNLVLCFEKTLIDAIVDFPCTSSTREFFVELTATFLVLCSTQLYQTIEDESPQLFLHHLYTPTVSLRAPAFVSRLLYICCLTELPEGSHSGGLFYLLSMSVSQILSLPWRIYNLIFSSQNDDLQLSDHSAFILLLLMYSKSPEQNTYVANLADLKDSCDSLEPSSNSFSFDIIFTRIVHGLQQESPWAPLMLYTLLITNEPYRNFLLSRSDVDLVIVPLLKILYTEQHLEERYHLNTTILITLLSLTQDGSFCELVHTRLYIAQVGWVEDILLKNISVGSLMMLVLFRALKSNMVSSRDPYLHENCIACLSNLAIYGMNLHNAVVRQIGKLLTSLTKNYVKSQSCSPRSRQNDFDLSALILQILDVIQSSLRPEYLPGNKNLVYVLLHSKQHILDLYKLHPDWPVLERIKETVMYFAESVEKNMTPSGIGEVLEQIQNASRILMNRSLSKSVPRGANLQALYEYQPAEDSNSFFLPHIWAIILEHSGLSFGEGVLLLAEPEAIEDDEEVETRGILEPTIGIPSIAELENGKEELKNAATIILSEKPI